MVDIDAGRIVAGGVNADALVQMVLRSTLSTSQRIKVIMAIRDVSQADIAAMNGISRQAVNNIVRGTTRSDEAMSAIAAVCGVPKSVLFPDGHFAVDK